MTCECYNEKTVLGIMKLFRLVLMIVFVAFIIRVAGYFVNQYSDAKVTTIGCVDKTKGPCRTYQGSLKTTFLTQDYVINDGKREIIIPKSQVVSISFTD